MALTEPRYIQPSAEFSRLERLLDRARTMLLRAHMFISDTKVKTKCSRTARNGSLCLCCKSLFDTRHNVGKTYIHHYSVLSLRESANQGCPICVMIWRKYEPHYVFTALEPQELMLGPCLCEFNWGPHGRIHNGQFISDDYECKFRGPALASSSPGVKLSLVSTTSTSSSAPLRQITATSTASEETWDTIVRWISNCNHIHRICRNLPSHFWHPTRLVYVGRPESMIQPRLCTGKDISSDAKYTTLSHCWGRLPLFTLLTSNIATLEQGIPIEKLCKTFTDAIFVTHRLGIPYLWIDSLCIIQDSTEDWSKESSTMGAVYKNSYCNISATGFSDGSKGMFVTRDPRLVLSCNVPIKQSWLRKMFVPDSVTRIVEGDYYCAETDFWKDGVSEAPLNERAWVCQERLLSQRNLHFGIAQVYWECREQEACELFPSSLPDAYRTGYKSQWRSRIADSSHAVEEHSDLFPLENNAPFHHWLSIVQNYTSGRLTKSEDKLVAISGIAQESELVMQAEYVAGLWHKGLHGLIPQLLWEIRSPPLAADYRDEARVPKPEVYRAPSWSWASTDGIINYSWVQKASEYHAEVLEVQVTPLDANKTGRLRAGFLRLRAALFRLSTSDNSEDTALEVGSVQSPLHGQPEKGTVRPSLKWDLLEHQDYLSHMLLPLCEMESHQELYTQGLIIKRTKGTRGEYLRVGTFIEENQSMYTEYRGVLKPDDYEDLDDRGLATFTII